MASACGAADSAPDGEDIAKKEGAWGHYDLMAKYAGDISQARGWIVEWQIPELVNPKDTWAAIGQWDSNLESGIYHTPGGGWFVYFFGDDNGLDGHHPDCDPMWGDKGGWCHGALGPLQAGARLMFKYESCTKSQVADVAGTQLCLYVDVENGAGWQFLTEDGFNGQEMYTHDIEHWPDDYGKGSSPLISCSAPTRMLHQEVWDASGNWRTLSGHDTWKFVSNAPYHFENQNLDGYPGSWDSCTTPDGPGNYDVRWDALRSFHPACGSADAAMSPDCAAAYSRFCSSGGAVSGYGPISKSLEQASVTCIDGAMMQAHFTDWSKDIPDCDGGAGHVESSACASAVSRHCQEYGFESGFGPVEHLGDEISIVCLDSTSATRLQSTYSTLRGYHSACDGSSERWGGDCSFAVSRFCMDKGARSGFGPVENSGDDVTVVCTY